MQKMKGKTRGRLTKLTMTPVQSVEAKEFGTIKKTTGGYQTVFGEIARLTSVINGTHVSQVYDDDLVKLKKWAARADEGSYQRWSRDVLAANKINWP